MQMSGAVFILFKSKGNGDCIFRFYGLAILLGRIPFRHTFHYPNGFLVEGRGNAFHHLDVTQGSVFIDSETNNDSSLYIAISLYVWIAEILGDVLHQCS